MTITETLLHALADHDGTFTIQHLGKRGQFDTPWQVNVHYGAGLMDSVNAATADEAIDKALVKVRSRTPEQRRLARAAELRAQLAELEQAA